ncbi:MAG: excinuclease ABC subunit UvrC [Candidatus Nanoarchaeia archaeon]
MIEIIEGKCDFTKIPLNPGVYLYKDETDNIIYIGKAKNLRNRVKNYFQNTNDQSAKTRVLVSRIKNIDFIIVNNEVEALLLENNLIKKHSPKYNINLKDSKTYAYIKITNEPFPKILSVRKVENDHAKYFGPYTDGFMRRELVKLIIQIYKIRICNKLPKKTCLQYHLGLCNAPCINEISEEEYNKNVSAALDLLKGHTENTLETLQNEMKLYSQKEEYEKALSTRKKIESVETLFTKQNVERIKKHDEDVIVMIKDNNRALITMISISKGTILGKKEYVFDYTLDVLEEFIKIYYSTIDVHKIPSDILVNQIDSSESEAISAFLSNLKGSRVSITIPQRGEKANLVKLAIENTELNLTENASLIEIKEKLNLQETPTIIECFDISNLGYEHIVAAMVRYTNAKPDKKEYRKFLIRSVQNKNDDYESIREVIYRRYKKLKEENEAMPSLVIIDGGKGQLNAALDSLRKLELTLPIIGLAKENEEIFLPNEETALRFNKSSKMMLLIRQIRDSTHNFVISYNKKRREMKTREQFANLRKK